MFESEITRFRLMRHQRFSQEQKNPLAYQGSIPSVAIRTYSVKGNAKEENGLEAELAFFNLKRGWALLLLLINDRFFKCNLIF